MPEKVEYAYAFLMVLSLLLTVICLLVGFYANIETVKAMGIVYALMTVTGLIMLASGKIAAGENHLLAYTVSLFSLTVIAVLSSFFTRTFRIMGILEVTKWPTEVAEQPLIIGIGSLALTLSITPQLLTTLLLQLPTGTGEESFFRVFLINVLEPIMGTNFARVASAISFGIMHYLAYQMQTSAIITATLAGYALAYVYTETRSATAVCLAHTTWNIISLVGASILGGA